MSSEPEEVKSQGNVFKQKGEELLSEIISVRCTKTQKEHWNNFVNARKQGNYGDARDSLFAMLKYCSSPLVSFFTGIKFK